MKNRRLRNWRVPALLLLLGSLNILSGAFRLGQIQQGPTPTTEEGIMIYFIAPIPIILHIVSGILFNLLGPLQFVQMRGRWRQWHRRSGRVLIGAGVIAALTALYMNHFYPAYGGVLKYPGIFFFSIVQLVSLGCALYTVRSRDFISHRAWMMRAVATGLGPATQRVIFIPLFLLFGEPTDLVIGLVIWIGFGLNLLVVEFLLWRGRQEAQPRATPAFGGQV